MSGYTEEDPEFNVVYNLNEYADRHPEFNSAFLDGVIKFYECQKYITQAQLDVLNKISRDVLKKIEG
jgi:hypothetical protein